MMQNIELNKMGLTPMTEEQMTEVDGGFLFLFVLAAAFVIGYFIGTASNAS